MYEGFLPVNREDMLERGWTQPNFVYVMGDAYVDHSSFGPAIISRVKIMANLNIAERRIPQDGRIAITVAGRPVDLRVSCLPTTHGESVVMRILDQSATSLDLENVGLPEDVYEQITMDIEKPNGIIVVTGPTTLLALLNSLQMGFRTIAIEKRSSEVWELLGAVKTEFGKFAVLLDKTQKRLRMASDSIEDAARKTRTIQRKLSGVQALSEPDSKRLIDLGDDEGFVDETDTEE